jgi:hypothetical protein
LFQRVDLVDGKFKFSKTSSVCSPNSGGHATILLGVRDSVTGEPIGFLPRLETTN